MSQVHDEDSVQRTVKQVSGQPYENFFEYQIDDGRSFIVSKPVSFLKEEIQEPPFRIKVFEECVSLPGLGFFSRYKYEILICDEPLNSFHNTDRLSKEDILEEFEGTIKGWLNEELKI